MVAFSVQFLFLQFWSQIGYRNCKESIFEHSNGAAILWFNILNQHLTKSTFVQVVSIVLDITQF